LIFLYLSLDEEETAKAGHVPCDEKCQLLKKTEVTKTAGNLKSVESTLKPKTKKKSAKKAAKAKPNASESDGNNKKVPNAAKAKKKGKKSSSGGKSVSKSAPEAAASSPHKNVTHTHVEPNSTKSNNHTHEKGWWTKSRALGIITGY
jgi:hypothetical protein